MNKKIKIIDLFNKRARKEQMPCKIEYGGEEYQLEDFRYINTETKRSFGGDFDLELCLFNEVEILEDNTEEIEELGKEQEAIANPKTMMQEIRFYYDANKMGDKINELVRIVNSIRKNIDKEYCCNCGVEITDENRALHNMCNECKYGIDWEEKTK